MDFKETILESKWFEYAEEGKKKTSVHLINPNTCADFMDDRQKAFNEEEDQEKRKNVIIELVGKHLVIDWKNVKYRGKNVPFTKNNVQTMLKNSVFRFWILSIVFDPDRFMGELELDFEGIEKN